MYGDEPLTINPGLVERLDRCPAAEGAGTRLPRGNLDRWIAEAVHLVIIGFVLASDFQPAALVRRAFIWRII